jgi:hypothetical protein
MALEKQVGATTLMAILCRYASYEGRCVGVTALSVESPGRETNLGDDKVELNYDRNQAICSGAEGNTVGSGKEHQFSCPRAEFPKLPLRGIALTFHTPARTGAEFSERASTV